eukprot:TRINITY_DN112994_c0_g1_i1.p1 TRINITY_DN112994_c0_g1~~TRINITY_DN112994_c0_g1_i1.p1  ORF type:complete len:575 (+),score=0.35 TRINITY_DN112994_c0_g1_i1:82-1725(+)
MPDCMIRQKPKNTVLPQKDGEAESRHKEIQKYIKLYQASEKFNGLPPLCREISFFDVTPNPSYNLALLRPSDAVAWDSLESLEAMYHLHQYKMPASAEIWNVGEASDLDFAEQRLVGDFPFTIEQIRTLPKHVKIKPHHIEGLLDPDLDFQTACQKGKIFMVDYSKKLKDIPLKNGGWLSAPTLLLYHNNNKQLVPLAIQLFPATDPPICTMNDNKYAWMLAKIHFQCAETHWRFFGAKIYNIHFCCSIYASTTFRCLSTKHPVRQLLTPYLRGSIASLNYIVDKLLVKGGLVDNLFGVGLEGGLAITRKAHKDFFFINFGFGNDYKNRNCEALKGCGYHAAEDGLLIWEAIKKYVRNIMDLFYTEPADIINDTELHQWAQELKEAIPSVICLKEYTLDPLVFIVTNIIWTCTAYHSALNDNLYDTIGFVPNKPFSVQYPWPRKPKDEIVLKDILLTLPSKTHSLAQVQWVQQMRPEVSSPSVPRLQEDPDAGHYEEVFVDSCAHGLYLTFLEYLRDVEAQINKQNSQRTTAYTAMLPSKIAKHVYV